MSEVDGMGSEILGAVSEPRFVERPETVGKVIEVGTGGMDGDKLKELKGKGVKADGTETLRDDMSNDTVVGMLDKGNPGSVGKVTEVWTREIDPDGNNRDTEVTGTDSEGTDMDVDGIDNDSDGRLENPEGTGIDTEGTDNEVDGVDIVKTGRLKDPVGIDIDTEVDGSDTEKVGRLTDPEGSDTDTEGTGTEVDGIELESIGRLRDTCGEMDDSKALNVGVEKGIDIDTEDNDPERDGDV